MLLVHVLERLNENPYHREFAIRTDNDIDLAELHIIGYCDIHSCKKKKEANDWLLEYMDKNDLLEDNQTII